MHLNLFGGFSLLDEDGEVLRVRQKRGQALLAYLALKDGCRENRELLTDLLWPDRFKKQAQASLRQVLFELRKISPSNMLILANRNEVSLGPAIDACDVWSFVDCVKSRNLTDASLALRLHKKPFLDGPPLGSEPFQQWAAIQRARLESKLDHAVLNATAEAEDAGSNDQKLALLDQLVQLNPMCMEAMLRVMEIEARNDNILGALQKYQRYVRRLKIEFDEEPIMELKDAYNVLKSAPTKRLKFPTPRRRPAQAQRDPWRKTSLDAPVVAVLPFRYLGDNRTGAAIAAAIGEDVTLMLSGCRWFSVLSRSATHSFVPEDRFIPKDFVNRTGADYLVYGAVVERENNWSVTIELADAESGLIVWAKRYDTSMVDLMNSSHDLCPLIAAALDPAIAESERNAFARPSLAATGSIDAYHHLVFGYRHYYAGNWREAYVCFQKATEADATYAHAYAMMATTTYYIAQIERNHNWRDDLKKVEKLAHRALEIDSSEPKACMALGQALDWQGHHDHAYPYLETAASRNPSFSNASTARAYHAVMTGAFDQAKELMEAALRLRVGDNNLGLCLPAKALADLHLGNISAALKAAYWAARMRPDFWLTRQVLAAALLAAGEKDAAKRTVASMRDDYAGLSGKAFAGWFPYSNTEIYSPVTETFQYFGWS